jgi:hypothetical protein
MHMSNTRRKYSRWEARLKDALNGVTAVGNQTFHIVNIN